MKFQKFLTTITLSAVALTSALLQAATTDPIGGMVIPIKGASDTRISLPFSRAVYFEGRVDSISSNVITAVGTPGWADNQFLQGDADNPADDDSNSYYLVFLTGAKEGTALEISGNASSSVTVNLGDDDLVGVLTDAVDGAENGDIFQIIPYWTLDTLFTGSTLADQTVVFRYTNTGNAVNRSAAEVLTYFTGFGWFDTGGGVADDQPLNVAEGIIIRTPPGSSDFDIVVSGAVPMFQSRFVFATDNSGNPNDILFSVYSPVPVAVGTTGLGDVADQTVLFVYDNESTATNKSASEVLTYFDGFGWFDSLGALVDSTFMLEPGQNYILRKPGTLSADEVVWTYLPSYLQ